MKVSADVSFELPDAIVDAIVDRVLERLGSVVQSEFLTVAEAAEFLRCKPQRVYDLLSSGRLTRFKDGSRVLISRGEAVAYLTPPAPQNGSLSRVAA